MNGNANLHRWIAIPPQRHDAINKVRIPFGNRQRIPSQLIRRSGDLDERTAANELGRNLFVGPMRHGRTNAIGPRPAIRRPRSREWASAALLRVQAESMLLWRILTLRQATCNSLGGKF